MTATSQFPWLSAATVYVCPSTVSVTVAPGFVWPVKTGVSLLVTKSPNVPLSVAALSPIVVVGGVLSMTNCPLMVEDVPAVLVAVTV